MLARRTRFWGRTSEFKQLASTLENAVTGTPFAVTVEGEAGIGKSRLVEEATQAVTGFRLLWGKASELERERPFGPVLDALELRSHDVTRLLSEQLGDEPPGPGEASQFAIADYLLDLFERASAEGPVVLVVEDVHWADAATLSLMARLARQRGPLNTSLLCTRRPSPRSTSLEALLKALVDEGGTDMRLGPLPDDDIEEIVAELAGARPGPTLSARVRGASGNPLYVIEFVEGLGRELIEQAGVADVSDASVPSSLPLTILHRLGMLPAETIELLRTAAILGASFRLSELVAVAGRPALELIALLQPAIDGGIVIVTTDGFRFRHDLIHEAAYTDIPAPLRRVIHADAATILAADPTAEITHVARHFELGNDGPDAAAADWLWDAAEAMVTVDRGTAIELMERSAARTPPDHPQLLDRRVLAAVRAANQPGTERLDRARDLLSEPLPDLHRWLTEGALVIGWALAGEVDEAEELAFARPRPRIAQVRMAVALVAARCFLGDPAGAERVMNDLVVFVGGGEEDDAQLQYVYTFDRDDSLGLFDFFLSVCRGLVAWTRGENEAGPAIARRSEELVQRLGAPPQSLDCGSLILGADSNDDGWRESLRRIGSVASHALPEIDAGAGFAYWLAGEWDEALAHFETSRRRAEECGPRVSDSLLAVAALIEAERGHTQVAREWLARSQAFPQRAGLGMWVEAVLAEVEGDIAGARQLLVEAWRRDDQAGVRVWLKHHAADLVRHGVASGDDVLVREVISVVEALVARGGDIASAVAKNCRALIEGSAADLVEAAELFRRFGRPVDAARADEDAAAASARSDATRAQQLFDSATAVYEALGAKRDLARLTVRLREAGMSRKAISGLRPRAGWGSLTESELRVAELASRGLTYRAIGERLYVSRRTVETHVAHVFVKLNVRSKAELASAYAIRFGAQVPAQDP